MNLIRQAAASLGLERRSMSLLGNLAAMDQMMDWSIFGQQTYTGRHVSQLSAMQITAVWACIDVRSADVATTPIRPFRRTGAVTSSGEWAKELAIDHYLYPLLTHQANPFMTSFRFKQLMESWIMLWGNACAEIEINGRGQVIAFWPMRWDRMRLHQRADGGLLYEYRRANDETVVIRSENMLHIRGLGIDGIVGLSPIDIHRQTIGLAGAVQEHGARFFGNGARPLGVLTFPGKMSEENIEKSKQNWERAHMGLTNAHRVAILTEGLQYKETGLSMVDAQYLEVNRFTIEEIARMYRMPLHKIGHLDRMTNNNVTELSRGYVQGTLGPVAANWCNELAFTCLSQREALDIVIVPDFRYLLRADIEKQGQFYKDMVNGLMMTPDEAREDYGMNPLPNDWGSKPLRPLNVSFAGEQMPTQMGQQYPANPPPGQTPVKPNGAFKQ